MPPSMLARVLAFAALLGAVVLGGLPGIVKAVAAEGVWPLIPRPDVVRGFDPPERRWLAGHRGVDLRGSPGQVVRSALAGRVSFAGRIAGRGIVVVSHGATRTTYQPVTPSVRVGDRVGAGTKIGALVGTGSHCFPAACLHWGLIRGEVYLNPLTLVGVQPVRLLPLHSSSADARMQTLTASPPLPVPAAAVAPMAAVRATPLITPVATAAELTGRWPLRPAGVPAGRPGEAGPW